MKTWVEINTFVLTRNVRQVKAALGEGARLYAVVGADAYGHGLEVVADAIWRGGADAYVVADTQEALTLIGRKHQIPILLITPPEHKYLPSLINAEVHIACFGRTQYEEIGAVARRLGRRARIELEIETGMHQLGLSEADATAIMKDSAQTDREAVAVDGIFTRLYAPDDPEIAHRQIAQFSAFNFSLQQAGFSASAAHVLSGDAYFGAQDYHDALFDGVRVGGVLYGAKRERITTEPILTWKTRLVAVSRLRRGDTAGYGATYTCERDRPVGVLPVGYGDGLDQRLGNAGQVLVQGKRCAVIGQVSMNNTLVDLMPVYHPHLGDEVVLIGRQGSETITAADMARWAQTLDKVILTQISQAIPRIEVRSLRNDAR